MDQQEQQQKYNNSRNNSNEHGPQRAYQGQYNQSQNQVFERTSRFNNAKGPRIPFRSVDESSSPSHSSYSSNASSASSSIRDYPKLTPMGYEHPLKSAILARFRADLALPMEVDASLHEDVWVESGLREPLCWRELGVEEEAAVASGHFNKFVSKNAQGGVGAGSVRGGRPIRGGRGGAAVASNNPAGGRGPSQSEFFGGDSNGSSNYGSLQEESFLLGRQRGNSELQNSNNTQEQEDDSMWNMPTADSAFGSFDSQGNFSIPSGDLKSFKSPSSLDESHQPGHDRLPPPNSKKIAPTVITNVEEEVSMAPPGLGNKNVLVHPETKWLYRDPAGQIQGPFPNKKMLHWYSRAYFPETLPLRREEDILYEPLSLWKIKCGGICPFELGLEDVPVVLPVPEPVKQQQQESPSLSEQTTANVFAKLGIPWSASSTTSTTSSLPPMNEPVTTQDNRSPSLLQEDQLQFLQQFSSKPAPTDVRVEEKMEQLSVNEERKSSLGNAGWKKVEPAAILFNIGDNLQSPTLKSFSPPPTGSEVGKKKEWKPVQAISTPIPSTNVGGEVSLASAPAAGWARPMSSVAKPLSEIMREEEEAQAAAAAARNKLCNSNNNAPKSFAETLRLAELAKLSNSPLSTPVIPVAQVSPIVKATAPKDNLDWNVAGAPKKVSVPSITPVVPATPIVPAHTPIITTILSKPAPNKNLDVKNWCLAQLKALEASYDINMCTILLLEFKTAAEVASFIEDNIRSNKIDMAAFTTGLIERRFGSAVAAPLVKNSEIANVDVDFVTVSRKPSRKPSNK